MYKNNYLMFVLLFLLAFAISISSLTVYADENIVVNELVESENVSAVTSVSYISDGTYCINGKQSGCYLRYNGTSIFGESGMISTFGDSICWTIRNVGDGSVIQPVEDSTKYLAVPTSGGTSPLLMSITGSYIPYTCKWDISTAVGGGCRIKSIYNSKYLYTFNGYLSLDDSTGDTGTSAFSSRIWRITAKSNIEGHELLEGFTINTCYLFSGESVTPVIKASPSNAFWTQPSDFMYGGYNSSVVQLNSATGTFTAVSNTSTLYYTTVRATHKVTKHTTTFTLVVNPEAILMGIPSEGHEHLAALSTSRNYITSCGYSSARLYSESSYTASQIKELFTTDTNNMYVVRSHGGESTLYTFFCINSTGTSAFTSLDMRYLDLDNMKLMMFIACKTGNGGDGGANLPTVAVQRGAKTAVGFESTIDCGCANEWTKEFLC